MTLPTTITVTQVGLTPELVLVDGAISAPPVGLPPYPVEPDPTKTYTLTYANGQLAWVAVSTVPIAITAPGTGTVGTPLALSGSVYPPSDSVVFGLSDSPEDKPATGLVAATNVSGALSGSITPALAGTFYAWAIDTATGHTAVSGAIEVSAAPAG